MVGSDDNPVLASYDGYLEGHCELLSQPFIVSCAK